MSAKKEKGKGKTAKVEMKVEEKFKPSPVHIHIKIETIKNFQCFHKLSSEFSIELYHANKILPATNPLGGKFYICTCPNDDLLVGENADVLDLNLHYVLTLHVDEINDLRALADSPIFVILNIFTDKVPDFPRGEEEESERNIDKSEDVKSSTKEEAKSKEFEKAKRKDSETSKSGNKGKNKKGEKAKEKGEKTKSEEKHKDVSEDKSNTKPAKERSVGDEGVKILKIPIGFGYFDPLHIVSKKPIDTRVDLYLYPEFVYSNIKTPKVTMYLYSVMGILQNISLTFCNSVAITFESVYNIAEIMEDRENKVHVDFSLVFSEDLHQRYNVFSFSDGHLAKFKVQEKRTKWSSLPNVKGLGALMSNLCPNDLKGIYIDNVELFKEIKKHDPIYAFDSMHRIFLTEEDSINLEHLINYESHQICVEIKINDESDPRYIGFVDLAPLLYPGVSSGRFCVNFKAYHRDESHTEFTLMRTKIRAQKQPDEIKSLLPGDFIPTSLKSPRRPPKEVKKVKEKKKKTPPEVESSKDILEKRMFAVFKIELYKPITDRSLAEDCEIEKSSKPKCYCEDEMPLNEEKLARIVKKEFEDEVITIIKQLPNFLKDITVYTSEGMRIDCNKFKEMDCYLELRDNLMERITRFVAAKYNVQNPTKTNQDFKNLMVTVYNDLTMQIDEIINDYFAGTDTYTEVSKVSEFKDSKVFSMKESRELDFRHITDSIWASINYDPEDEDHLVDMIIKELEELEYYSAMKLLSKLIERNSTNYYGMLIQLYFTYMDDTEETQVWLNQLIKITQIHPTKIELWCLLYVFFKDFDYRAGYMHAKMNYELNFPPEKYPYFYERKEIYYDITPTKKPLCYSVYIFLKIGLYKFADIIFNCCMYDFPEKQRYHLKCALLYLQDDLVQLKDFLKNIPSEQFSVLIKTFNGHMMIRFDMLRAVKEYEIAYHSIRDHSKEFYHVAFLRCGFWDIGRKRYDNAKSYFSTCCVQSNSFLSWYGLGICCFRLGEINEAEKCFSKASNLHSKIAELWFYLAIINLNRGKISKAKECYEVARRNSLSDLDLLEEVIALFRDMNVEIPPEF